MAIEFPDFQSVVPGAVGATEKLGGMAGMGAKIKSFATGPGGKIAGGALFASWLLNKIMESGHETGMRNLQQEGLRRQGELATPENLYYQAAQPQAHEEEAQARQALYTQMAGGVIGPQLAQGEFSIGG